MICLVVYTKGVQALMRLEQNKVSPLVGLVSPGAEYSALKVDGKCLAHFESHLDLEHEKPTLSGTGTFYVNLQGQSLLAKLSIDALFASYYRLENFTGKIELGNAKVELQTVKGNDRIVEVLLQLREMKRKLVFPRPEPIFLQPSGEKYSIRLPGHIERSLVTYVDDGMASSIPEGAEFVSLEKAESDSCLESLQDGGSAIAVINSSGILEASKSLGGLNFPEGVK